MTAAAAAVAAVVSGNSNNNNQENKKNKSKTPLKYVWCHMLFRFKKKKTLINESKLLRIDVNSLTPSITSIWLWPAKINKNKNQIPKLYIWIPSELSFFLKKNISLSHLCLANFRTYFHSLTLFGWLSFWYHKTFNEIDIKAIKVTIFKSISAPMSLWAHFHSYLLRLRYV